MAAPGSQANVQWGFKIGDAATLLTIGGTAVGFVNGAITVRVPRTVASLRADMYAMPIDTTVTTKDAFIAFTMAEVLGGNLAAAWGSGAYAGSSVVVATTDAGQVAVIIVTRGPDGATTTVTMTKATSMGDGTWTLPFSAAQTIAAEFQGSVAVAATGEILKVVHS
jgi:hypothetical protein